jgi:hypothetical protein
VVGKALESVHVLDMTQAFDRSIAYRLDLTAAGTAQPAARQLSGTRPEHPPAKEGNNQGRSRQPAPSRRYR